MSDLLCWRCKPGPCCYDGPSRPGWVITNHLKAGDSVCSWGGGTPVERDIVQAELTAGVFQIEIETGRREGVAFWSIYQRGGLTREGSTPVAATPVVDVQREAEAAMRRVVAERREHLTAVLARLDELGE